MLLKSITMRPALPSSLHADPSHSSLDDLCTQSLQFDHQNPESPEPQVGTPLNRTAPASFRSAATSASSFGLDLFSAFETGLRLASAVTSSSFHLANNINSATAHFADRSMSLYSHAVIHLPHRLSTRAGITATAEATSTKMGSVVECLDLDDEWHKTVQERIISGSSKLKEAVTSISSGVEKALGIAHVLASSGIKMSLETVRGLSIGLESALICAGVEPTRSKQHGLLQAAQAILDVLGPLSNVSPLDIGRALGAVSMIQEAARMPYPPTRCRLIDLNVRHNRDLMNDLAYRYRQTLAVYSPGLLRLCDVGVHSKSSGDLIRELLGVDSEAVLVQRNYSEIHHPAHILMMDHSSRSICVIIRGSTEAPDLLTDLSCQPDPAFGSHSGMQSSAVSIDCHIRPTVHQLCEQYPQYRVIVEGHSLGGGTATLLCLLWLRDPVIAGSDGRRLHAFSFGCPAVVTLGTASQYSNNITSIISARDIVSRASWGAMVNLNNVLLHLCSKDRPSLDAIRRSANSQITDTNLRSISDRTNVNGICPNVSYFDDHPIPPLSEFLTPSSSGSFHSDTSSPVIPPDVPSSSKLQSAAPIPTIENQNSTHSNNSDVNLSSDASIPNGRELIRPNNSKINRSPYTDHLEPMEFSSTGFTSTALNSAAPALEHPVVSHTVAHQSPNVDLLEHLETLTTSTLLHLLEAKNSLPSSASEESRDYWDSQIRIAATSLQSLHSDDNVLSPAGRCILVMPVDHYALTGRPIPEYLTPGNFVLIDLDDDGIADMSKNILISREAFADHLPLILSSALGLNLSNGRAPVEDQSEMSYFYNMISDDDDGLESPLERSDNS